MKPNNTQKRVESIRSYLRDKEVKKAINHLSELVDPQNNWKFSERLSELDSHYRYMLHYLVEGEKDPKRDKIYTKLIRDIYTLTDDAAEQLLLQDSSSFFFEKLRIQNVRSPLSIDEYADTLLKQSDTFSFIDLLDDGPEKVSRIRQNQQAFENTVIDLFYTVYTSPRSNVELTASFERFIQNELIPVRAKSMFISALTLNILHRFDFSKVILLLDTCRRAEPDIACRAIIGLIPIFQKYQTLWPYYPECTDRFKLLSDDPLFNRRFLAAIIGFIQAHETEKITKRLTEEILPEMMKLSPFIGKKINLEEWMGESGIEEKNPDWQKVVEESGFSDRLEELSELQMEGADLFHSTFSNMKSYPFFREMSNWFLPFNPRHTTLGTLFINKEPGSSLLETMFTSSLMCDSDKYSFCFSIQMIPENYQQMILGQLGAEGEEMKELIAEEQAINPHQKDENIIKQYIQNLYRFFKLHPRKAEFLDIFNLPLNYHEIEPFYPVVRKPNYLERIALYYFEKNNFNEAIGAYTMLIEEGNNESEPLQKIGFAKQMLGDIQGALDAYLHADLLEENNTWVLNRIAYCYRALKKIDIALSYYRRLEQYRPDDLTIQLNIGHCYLELNNYDEALNYYFKVELLDSNNSRAWRPIAWCALLSRKFNVARDYYARIIDKNPAVHDYLNAGHVEICLDNIKQGVHFYTLSQKEVSSIDAWRKLLYDDEKVLLQVGVDTSILPFILDKMRYNEEEQKTDS